MMKKMCYKTENFTTSFCDNFATVVARSFGDFRNEQNSAHPRR